METHLPTHLAGSNCYIYWSYKWSEQYIKCFMHTQVKGAQGCLLVQVWCWIKWNHPVQSGSTAHHWIELKTTGHGPSLNRTENNRSNDELPPSKLTYHKFPMSGSISSEAKNCPYLCQSTCRAMWESVSQRQTFGRFRPECTIFSGRKSHGKGDTWDHSLTV